MHLLSQNGMPTWIVIANGSRANVFTLETIDRSSPTSGDTGPKSQHTLQPVNGMEMQAEPIEKYDLGRHSPAKVEQSGTPGPSMSGGEPRETVKEQIRHEFARDLAKKLNEACTGKKCGGLVIVASPPVLSTLRSDLNKVTRACVTHEFSADLTHFSGQDLLTRIVHLMQPDAIAS